jgi:hypothetical protein
MVPLYSIFAFVRGRVAPEGSAYVSTGTLAGNIVVLDGYDVFAFPLDKPRKGTTGATKVFNLKALSILGHPMPWPGVPPPALVG